MKIDHKSIFEKGLERNIDNYLPSLDIPERKIEAILPEKFCRERLDLNAVPEVELMRHYTNLSCKNYGVENGIYPLGSCTMKYNPNINEIVAKLPGFSNIHPLQKNNEGAMELMKKLASSLGEITAMDAFTFLPAAGAHGELTGMFIIKKYFETLKIKKNKIIVPDSAHGTNPASAKMAGFSIVELRSNDQGQIPLDQLKYIMEDDNVAGMMLTNPNTLGIFEQNVKEITQIVHDHEGLCYYDGANLNPMLGISRPGDMGFDIVHLNLHKTFSTPHGGGGPGAGPVGVKKHLIEFLPKPYFVSFKDTNSPTCNEEHSIGRINSYWGNFGVLVRSYCYIKALGGTGLKGLAQISVLNANYLRVKLQQTYDLPYDRLCKHEFVLSEKGLPNELTTEDIAKRILDFGIYAPTIYFPLIVKGAMMVEPTETESKTSLDHFINTMEKIYKEAETDPEKVKNAPHTMPVKRLDAVLAARKPVLKD
ncbi:MAG: aminotransferase class V-fold PLP-dependent enzyme [Candidatus Lokiarchaeota archaeon]|nr:aminotransferase class V-fold PLP-dependent enzyme [Candidatus Lokiarchaeota archaeon]MBD3338094.1 aminotransferase class V-fold PLP-dependent enzyme [Candidatus Lokiarchaeota archaeon]